MSTYLTVLRANGQLMVADASYAPDPLSGASTWVRPLGSPQQSGLLSSLDARVTVAQSTQDTLLDFDVSCVTATRALKDSSVTGIASEFLGCGAGEAFDGPDVFTLGRISVAVGDDTATGRVSVLTYADKVQEEADGFWRMQTEARRDGTECVITDPLTSADRAGSFDLRTVMGVTHLACVREFNGGVAVDSYVQPLSEMALQAAGAAQGRDPDYSQTSLALPARTTYDTLDDPGPGEARGPVPLRRSLYSRVSGPVVQLKFPCAQLLARPLRSGTSLDDCDPSTVPAPTTPATQAAAPPYNWTSFKVAAYADSSGSGGTGRRLVVSTIPPPPRRTKHCAATRW